MDEQTTQLVEAAFLDTVETLASLLLLLGHDEEKVYQAFLVMFKTLEPGLPFEALVSSMRQATESN